MSVWEAIIHCGHILVWICPAWHLRGVTWVQEQTLRSEELSKQQNRMRHGTGRSTPSCQAGKQYRPVTRRKLVTWCKGKSRARTHFVLSNAQPGIIDTTREMLAMTLLRTHIIVVAEMGCTLITSSNFKDEHTYWSKLTCQPAVSFLGIPETRSSLS